MHKFEILIRTNQYAGNFNGELCAFVFGYSSDFSQDWILKLAESFREDHRVAGLEDLLSIQYNTHGETVCEIENSNNLVVFFNESPEKYMPAILERLIIFPKVLAESWEYAPKDVEIEEISLSRVIVEREEICFIRSKA